MNTLSTPTEPAPLSSTPPERGGPLRLLRRPGLHRRRGERQRAPVLRPPRPQVRREAPQHRHVVARRDGAPRRVSSTSDGRGNSAERSARPAPGSPRRPFRSSRRDRSPTLRPPPKTMTSSPGERAGQRSTALRCAPIARSARGPAGRRRRRRARRGSRAGRPGAPMPIVHAVAVDARRPAPRAWRSDGCRARPRRDRPRGGCRSRTPRRGRGRSGTPGARTMPRWRRGGAPRVAVPRARRRPRAASNCARAASSSSSQASAMWLQTPDDLDRARPARSSAARATNAGHSSGRMPLRCSPVSIFRCTRARPRGRPRAATSSSKPASPTPRSRSARDGGCAISSRRRRARRRSARSAPSAARTAAPVCDVERAEPARRPSAHGARDDRLEAVAVGVVLDDEHELGGRDPPRTCARLRAKASEVDASARRSCDDAPAARAVRRRSTSSPAVRPGRGDPLPDRRLAAARVAEEDDLVAPARRRRRRRPRRTRPSRHARRSDAAAPRSRPTTRLPSAADDALGVAAGHERDRACRGRAVGVAVRDALAGAQRLGLSTEPVQAHDGRRSPGSPKTVRVEPGAGGH